MSWSLGSEFESEEKPKFRKEKILSLFFSSVAIPISDNPMNVRDEKKINEQVLLRKLRLPRLRNSRSGLKGKRRTDVVVFEIVSSFSRYSSICAFFVRVQSPNCFSRLEVFPRASSRGKKMRCRFPASSFFYSMIIIGEKESFRCWQQKTTIRKRRWKEQPFLLLRRLSSSRQTWVPAWLSFFNPQRKRKR